MMFKLNLRILLLLLCSVNAMAQDPRLLLNKVLVKLSQAKNYKADINISVDLPYIKMMPINTKLYFKQKDKFKIDTKSIAILPKQGFLQLNMLLTDTANYTAIQQNQQVVNGVKTSLINLLPNNDTGDIVLAKLWVDPQNQVIIKSQLTTKSSGTIITEYTYGLQLAYGLPDVIKFIVDVKKFKIPKVLAGDLNTTKSKKVEKSSGEIVVIVKNYEVNKGIPDSTFQ